MLSMSLALILTLFSTIPSGQTAADHTALRFGQTAADYIQLPDWNVSYWNRMNRLSVCTWIKKLFSESSRPIVLQIYKIVTLGDDGYYWVADTTLNLRSNHTRGIGTWFHVCLIWSGEDRRIRVYWDGRLIGTKVNKRSVLSYGKNPISLGNNAGLTKSKNHVFGGYLFKLNIYNRVLTKTEIKNMSSSMCSNQEENLTSIKVLSWEDIVSPEIRRSGDVFGIPIGCKEKTNKLEEELLKRLNITEQDLAESKNKSQTLEEKLVEIVDRLQKTKHELG